MTITYQVKNSIYVNLTNRCPCACTFCLRNNAQGVYGSDSLWLEREPTDEEVVKSLGEWDYSRFREVVFCGYGEPTERLDTLLAAAEWLIAQGYTSPSHLAIVGGSNGGLLVGACMTQRPELYAVAIPQVGVMDMLRYHKFTIGWNWAPDYGTREDSPEMFQYLLGYSPLHNLKPGVSYPATLVTTADHDDRVVPAHSFKFAATLQECNAGPNPTLIRIDSKAGHGGGKPMAKVLEEQADIYSFIMVGTGMKF